MVDEGDGTYLRAGSPEATWLERVLVDPEIAVTRNGEESVYRAILRDDDETRARVNASMSEKYGFADRIWAAVSDHEKTLPILPVPSTSAETASAARAAARAEAAP